MASEKHNEAEGWKSRLEDTACLPADAHLDKEAAWDALYTRLRNKPARKKKGWYWLAAACLLMAFCLPWITGHKKETGLAKKTMPVPAAIKNSATTIQYPVASKPRLTVTVVQAPQEHTAVTPRRDKAAPSLPTMPAPVTTAPIAQVTLTTVPDSPLLTPVAPAPKQPLPVVALNELEPPAEHGNPPGNPNIHNWQVKFNRGVAYTGTAQETESPVPRMFKIKLPSPKN